MSKRHPPTHHFFSKRPRMATDPGDAANDNQVAEVDLNNAPNDISKTRTEGPTQVELFKYPATRTCEDFGRTGSRNGRGSSILKRVTLGSVMLGGILAWVV